MTTVEYRILLVEDNPTDGEVLALQLERGDLRAEIRRVETRDQLERAIHAGGWDIVLTDHSLPGMSSLDVLDVVHEVDIDMPCVIVSGRIGEEAAVSAMRAGAADFLSKDRLQFLPAVVEREVRDARHRRARRQAERELDASQRQILHVFESISEGFLALRPDWRLTYINPRAEHLFGRDASSVRDRELWDAIPELPKDALRPVLETTLRSGEAASTEVFIQETGVWLEVRSYPASDGAALYVLDVTDRKASDDRQQELLGRLEYERSRLEAILNQLPSAVLAFDLPAGTLSLSNSRAAEIWGTDFPADASLEDVHEWLHGEPKDPIERSACPLVRTAEDGEAIWDEEVRIVRRDGVDRYLSFNSAPVRSRSGELLAVVATATDVTEYREVIGALEEREELLRLVIETLPVGLWIVDSDGRRVASNPVADEIFGLPESIPIDPTEHFDVRDVESGMPVNEWSFMTALRTGEARIGEFLEIRREDGERRSIISSTVPVRDGRGAVVAAIVVHNDVTELRQARMLYQRAEERYQQLVEHMPAITYIAEPWQPHNITYISPQIEQLTGFSPREVEERGGHWSLVPSPEERERLISERHGGRGSDHPPYLEYAMLTADGETVWVRDDATLLRDEHGIPMYWQGILLDITERRGLEEQLVHQAFHDPLTGLPNRALFGDRVEHALQRLTRTQSGLAILFLDLDNFKFVNDSLGHSAGDELVRLASQRIVGCLRSGDTAARMGGDEFTILAEDVDDVSGAVDLASRIMRAFRQPFIIDGRELFVSPSIGVRHTDHYVESGESLLRDADLAMYRAKQNGRARVEIFDRSMTHHTYERFEIEGDLHRAIRNREFQLDYQPIYSLTTGRAIASEALLRWNHPKRGRVSPGEFIGVAEESGLIVQIGELALEEACRQIADWSRSNGPEADVRIWVNTSGRQLMDPNFVAVVERLVEEFEIDPSRLGIEITESTMMERQEITLRTLRALREIGVALAIDDFGTGYSSLGALRELPVSTLKIDRAFVAGLTSKSEDHVIVAGILSLADALGLEVIAEGIEEAEQLERLRMLGCSLGQGFLLSRPMPADRLRFTLDAPQRSQRQVVILGDLPTTAALAAPELNGPSSTKEILSLYVDLVLSARQREAIQFIEDVIGNQVLLPEDVCLSVIQPALYEVGKRWERGEISVAHEHLATLISEVVVHRICERLSGPKQDGAQMLMAGVPGEQHNIGARIVTCVLQAWGYPVLHVGTNVPYDSLISYARELKPVAMLLSVTIPSNRRSAFNAIHRLRSGYDENLPILVGGQGVKSGVGFEDLPNVYVTPTVDDAIDVLEALRLPVVGDRRCVNH